MTRYRIVIAAGLFAFTTGAAAQATPPVPPVAAAVSTAPALALIDAATAAGRYDDARALLIRARAGGDTALLRLRVAELLLARGEDAAAAAAFTALVADPEVAAASHQGAGLAALHLGDLTAAVFALDAAVAADPAQVRAWTARGVAADGLRDWAAADDAYARAIALAPGLADAYADRGYSRLLRGNYAGAETDLAAAIGRDPALRVARNNLMLARAMRGDYVAAFAGATKRSLAHDLNIVGFAAMTRGDYAVAEGYLNRAMKLNPEFDHVAWANLQYLKQLSGAAVPTP